MDARPLLEQVARLLHKHGLEAILIGNAAAALQEAPVATVDLDFLIRKTPINSKRLKAIASHLGAALFHQHYPASSLQRLSRDLDGLQLDFMTRINGERMSFESLRSRATRVEIAGTVIPVARLRDVPASKKAAARPQDLAVLPLLEKVPEERRVSRKEALDALKRESEIALREQIRRLLALPPAQRTHFLRKRIGLRMTAV